MAIELADYQRKAREAIRAFWGNREAARLKQLESGKADQGERAGVTAGKNMDGFLVLVQDIVHINGLEHAQIAINRSVLTLPGFFRPTKLWDMLILDQGELIAALEFKSHIGPSFGNNFNNRAEEAIGTAHDLWTAYREGAFGKETPRPFLSWLILVEDAPGARAPVTGRSSHFPLFPEFRRAAYVERYNILCRNLVQEQVYTAVSVIVSPRDAVNSGDYSEMRELTGLKTFVTSLAAHVAAAAARHS